MKKFYLTTACLFFAAAILPADEPENTIQLTLKEAIAIAQAQSVDAAMALNEWKTAYWEYRTHQAEQLPEVNFTGTLPSYTNSYSPYQESDGSYTYVQSNWLGLNGKISIDQNVPLTGGKLSLNTSLDFTRQLGGKVYNEFMSIPAGITFTQPVFGVNGLKWKRRIEPVRYKEAKAACAERMEGVTLTAIAYFFNLLHAKENLGIAMQNLRNAGQLYEIAVAKRRIGHISESELMQLNLGALQARGIVTEAQSNLNARMFQLRSFLGLSENDMIEPVLPEWAPPLRMQYREVLEKAQENNSFAKNIIRRQLEADYAVATAKGNLRSISLYASIGYTGKDMTMDKAYNRLRSNQIVEVGVNIPLIDWGKRKGKVKVAESNREVVLSGTRREQMNFNQDIFLLTENFNNQAGQLEIARQADVIAARRYNMSIETFMTGKINILDLNDAQKSKDEAKLKHIEELYKYWNYYYNIRSVTLYDFQTGANLEPPTLYP
ncbi:MAG: TolC family protein [Tannerellaceae bacterium]|jgi:outer membrane protein TolC|nr:TolC family protein [Tannerellaceae bacterium]